MTAAPIAPTTFTLTPLLERTTVEIFGNLETANRQQLKQLVLDELARGQKHLVFDLARCPYIDSSGLGVLVAIAKRTREGGGKLELVNLSEELGTLFELTGLNRLFGLRGDR